MTSSVADAQRSPDSTSDRPATTAHFTNLIICLCMKLYTTIKESGEKVLKSWPGSRQDSQEAFRELVSEAIFTVLQNIVEFCKTSRVLSSGIKIVLENFVAATYDAYYSCRKFGPHFIRHVPYSGAIVVGLLSISIALAALFNRLK
eukprot:SM000021S06510  [mRNA]  locus=s21:798888:800190:- [translate_table: standard]